jgi:hypothetical protein
MEAKINADRLKEYAALIKEIEALEAKRATLVPMILNDMQSQDMTLLETNEGKWTVARHKVWNYSEQVEQAEASVADMKEEERENGKASATEKSVLRFALAK